MNLRGLVSVSGKPGLFKLIGQNKSGFILETLDDQKSKIVVNMNTAKMASLEDITIFGENGDIKLGDIFKAISGQKDLPDPKGADGKKLREFFFSVAPDHDEERVYSSDIKKIISWYNTISVLPLFTEKEPEPIAEGTATPSVTETVSKKAEPVKEKAAKSSTKPAGKSATRLSQKSK